jgi:hypothetical protein
MKSLFCGVQTTVLIQVTSFCLGSAPILVAVTWPAARSFITICRAASFEKFVA